MVLGLQGQPSKPTILCLCVLMWATRGCSGLYFYAYDYSSWINTVMVFRNTSILRDGGVLQMNPYTNATIGRALYKTAFRMRNSTNGSLASFNTSFVFAMNTDRAREYFGDGFAFLICPNPFRGPDLQVSAGGYLGMFNASTTGQLSNRIFAVEFDTHLNVPFNDPNDNHIGVDVNSVISLKTNDLTSLGITLNGGRKIICWIDYDGINRYLWVYLAFSPSAKPSSPAISMDLDLAPYMKDFMYVGFSSATGTRAELHTIYTWWFLSGFSSLTLPLSSPSSHQPLASLGKRSIVATIFTLVVALVFFGFLCILAWQRWRERSKHLIDIFLPVACWMYWKESITEEVRSTYYLKLATPTVELLAWLWRTRWVRRHDQPIVKTWWEMLLKRKMGSSYGGEAWQLENKRQKRCKLRNAFHVEPDMEVKDAAEMEEQALTLCIVAATGKSYKAENNSFIIVKEESKAKPFQRRGSFSIPQHAPDNSCDLFQRRGSFSIPQRAPDDDLEHVSIEQDSSGDEIHRGKVIKHVKGTPVPDLEMKAAVEMEEEASTSLIVRATGDNYKVGNNDFMIVKEENKAKLFQRRGSFSIPQHAMYDSGEHEIELANEKDASGPVVAPHQVYQGMDTSEVNIGAVLRHAHLKPETILNSTEMKLVMHPEDEVELTVGKASEEAKDQQHIVEYLVERDAERISGKAFGVRRGSFGVLPEDVILLEDAIELTGVEVSTEGRAPQPHVQYAAIEHDFKTSSSKGFDQRRGSFSVHPEDFSGVQAEQVGKVKKSCVQYNVEDDVKSCSGEGLDARRGSSSVYREDSMEFTGRQASKEGQDEQHYAEDAMSSFGKGLVAWRGSFMPVEDARSSTLTARPGPSDQILQSSEHTTSGQPPKPPPHHINNTNEDGKSHVIHGFLFD